MLDKGRTLMFDTDALMAIEDALNLPGITLKLDFWQQMSIKRAKVAVWAGLLHEDAAITMEQVTDALRGIDPGAVIHAVMEAWGICSPEPKEGDESDPLNPGTNLHGSDSGASPDTTSV